MKDVGMPMHTYDVSQNEEISYAATKQGKRYCTSTSTKKLDYWQY
jgi:hypothetical protein